MQQDGIGRRRTRWRQMPISFLAHDQWGRTRRGDASPPGLPCVSRSVCPAPQAEIAEPRRAANQEARRVGGRRQIGYGRRRMVASGCLPEHEIGDQPIAAAAVMFDDVTPFGPPLEQIAHLQRVRARGGQGHLAALPRATSLGRPMERGQNLGLGGREAIVPAAIDKAFERDRGLRRAPPGRAAPPLRSGVAPRSGSACRPA